MQRGIILIGLFCLACASTATGGAPPNAPTIQSVVLVNTTMTIAVVNFPTGPLTVSFNGTTLSSSYNQAGQTITATLPTQPAGGTYHLAIYNKAGSDISDADVAIGVESTLPNNNTAEGSQALLANTTGYDNTATGASALAANTTGIDNTANGAFALESNTTGSYNTANGENALAANTTGGANTANGNFALESNTTGVGNAAHGLGALSGNTSGSGNTADGSGALGGNTSGSGNIALGDNAGAFLTTGDNNIDIGNSGAAGEAATIRIGDVQTATYIAGISGMTVAGGVAVIVDGSGHLGTIVSSRRFKDEIQPMDKASEAILALQPVTFRYKHELDPQGIPQFGLVAEDVEKLNPDLVARDAQGKVYTVRYEAVNAMLLNEFLKEHRRVQELQKGMEALIAGLKEQEAQIQKVSARLEGAKPAAQVDDNNP